MSTRRRLAFWLCVCPLDMLGAVLVSVPLVSLWLAARLVRRARRRRIVLLVPGADIDAIAKKYGSLDPYLTDLAGGYFEHAYRVLFCASRDVRIDLKPEMTVYSKAI